MWKDVKEDRIFWDFIISANLNLSLPALEAEALAMKENIKGISRTNAHGYHSPVFNDESKSVPSIYHEFKRLEKSIVDFTNLSLAERNYNVAATHYDWWVNINPPTGYNDIHIHGKTDLIGVYYIKVPENSGDLYLRRNDGSSYSRLFKSIEHGHSMKVKAEPNRLYIMPGHLWHWVTENYSEENRISVAVNLNVGTIGE